MLYAGYDKLNDRMGAKLPLTNSEKANVAINLWAKKNNQQLDTSAHSRGGLTQSIALQRTNNMGVTGIPIVQSRFFGTATHVEDYLHQIRKNNYVDPKTDTLVLGKYVPEIENGKPNYAKPADSSYNKIAEKAELSFFDMGDKWDNLISKRMSSDDLFQAFNIPAIDDAVRKGQKIKFTHDPRIVNKNSSLFKEWMHLKNKHGYDDLKQINGEWHATR